MVQLAFAEKEPSFAKKETFQANQREGVWRFLVALDKFCSSDDDRRSEYRYPFPRLIELRPAAKRDVHNDESATVVVGKSISDHGIGFFHQQPITFRRGIASVQDESGRWIGLLVDITWCRFTQFGWYESGGRIIREVPIQTAG